MGPDVSVVVVAYGIARELPRTLRSLSPAYQRRVSAEDYEVLVVDNGSTPPIDRALVEGFGANFRLLRMEDAPPSPAAAVNRGIAESRGGIIGVLVDGARIVTPGLVFFARHGARLYDRSVVTTLGWYLGYDFQSVAMQAGYDRAEEDRLLDSIGWPQDGYRLFEIATLDESSTDGWFLPISESNALFLTRETWAALGGVDERFRSPGGGLVNLDTYRRAIELPGAEPVILLAEATFHQLHGGVATNAAPDAFAEKCRGWMDEYVAIRGAPWSYPRAQSAPTYLGRLPRPALVRFARAAVEPVMRLRVDVEPPLGPDFDRNLWASGPVATPADPRIARIVGIAQDEFRAGRYEAAAALARLVRSYAPGEPEPQRMLSLTGAWLPVEGNPPERRANAERLLGIATSLLNGQSDDRERVANGTGAPFAPATDHADVRRDVCGGPESPHAGRDSALVRLWEKSKTLLRSW